MTRQINESEQLLAVAGTLWLAVSTVMTGTDMANRRRDVVISGVLDQHSITLEHRRLILENDWVPMAAVNGLISLVLALLLVLVPIRLHFRRSLVVICLFASLIPITGAFSWLIAGFDEYTTMARVLAQSPG